MAAVVGMFVLILLGPSRQKIQQKFEIGAAGEIHIMPELSIEDGSDVTNQLPESIRNTPPPPEIEVEPEDTDPDAEEEIPKPVEAENEIESDYADIVSLDPDLAEVELVEMISPKQTSPCINVVRQVRPQYPSNISDAERRQPVIDVMVTFYVAMDGKVTASMIASNTGSPAFGDVVLRAVDQWQFAPIDYECLQSNGLWIKWPIRFHSPFRSARRASDYDNRGDLPSTLGQDSGS